MTKYPIDKPYNPKFYKYIDPHGRNDMHDIIQNVQNIQQNLNEPDTATFNGNTIINGINRTLPFWLDNIDEPILKIKKDFINENINELIKRNNNIGDIIYIFIGDSPNGHYRYFYQNILKVKKIINVEKIQEFVSKNPYLQRIIIPNRIEYRGIEFNNFNLLEYDNEYITFIRTTLEIKENEGRKYTYWYLKDYIQIFLDKNPYLQTIIIPNRDEYRRIKFNNFNKFISDSNIYYCK